MFVRQTSVSGAVHLSIVSKEYQWQENYHSWKGKERMGKVWVTTSQERNRENRQIYMEISDLYWLVENIDDQLTWFCFNYTNLLISNMEIHRCA